MKVADWFSWASLLRHFPAVETYFSSIKGPGLDFFLASLLSKVQLKGSTNCPNSALHMGMLGGGSRREDTVAKAPGSSFFPKQNGAWEAVDGTAHVRVQFPMSTT